MAKKKTISPIKVRIEVMPASEIRLHETKRDEYYSIYYVRMFFNTREECHWYDIVLPKGSRLYKKMLKRKSFPRLVFMANQSGEKYPMQIGRSSQIRRSHQISYGNWPTSFVVSVTWEKISPLDYIELLDKNI